MRIVKLRSGNEWRTDSIETVHRFHQICKEHGSQATWLPQTGLLVTTDRHEGDKGFPYEQWLHEAQEKSNV